MEILIVNFKCFHSALGCLVSRSLLEKFCCNCILF